MDKKEFIIKQLGRTDKKNYENYCITRIYHKLDRLDVKFVTQQLFKRDSGKIALADLYLPQINMIVEVDESHHNNAKEEDAVRTDEIIRNKLNAYEEVVSYDLCVKRIDVIVGIEEINLQVDDLVDLIRDKIDLLSDKFIPWKEAYYKPEYYIQLGFIDTADAPSFSTIQEVSELFNKQYKGTQKAFFEDREGSNIRIWCPKLQINGMEYNVPYLNEISEDGRTIYESSKLESENEEFLSSYIDGKWKHLTTRYVFAMFRDSSGNSRYRFRGAFELNKKRTLLEKKRVWEKTSDIINLTSYFS